jgi:hypothetical protein
MSHIAAAFASQTSRAKINNDSAVACLEAFDHNDPSENEYACSAVAMALAAPAYLLVELCIAEVTAAFTP